MWVEADMNLPSGESLARQIVHGQRYFESRFGRRCSEVWIPDVFGYPASMPQLYAAGGMRRFVTQKLSWNTTNRFPHHTFWWEGLDGTRVLTHFPPVDTYNAELTPAECAASVARFRDAAWSNWSLMPFGHGDGGGGPTREMLERARRLADLDGAPRVSIGSPAEFFERVEREALRGRAGARVARRAVLRDAPRHAHQPAAHQGSATGAASGCCARSSCGRRRPARAADLDDAVASRCSPSSSTTSSPARRSRGCTPTPSASTPAVAAELEQRLAALLDALVPEAPHVVNAAGVDRDEVIEVDGEPGACDRARQRDRPRSAAEAPDDRVVVTERSMTNRHLAVRWDSNGNITSIIAVGAARELLPPGTLGGRARAGAATSRCATTPGTSSRGHRGLADALLDADVGRGRRDRAAARPRPRPAPVRAVDRDRDLHDAGRITAARHRHRARLAARRAPAVDGVPARRARRHRRLRHPVRPRAAADPPVDVVGRRQVRGLRPPLRRRQRARLRRCRAQRRPLRARAVRRAGPGQPGARGALPRPRPPTAARTR